MAKKLVTYFSASGQTQAVARQLAEATGADLYEIQPENLYTDADLDWRNDNSRSAVEMHDDSSRPAIAGEPANLANYDTIFIGFPIWWNKPPTVINTFLESHNIAGKTIVPFATAGSSGIENAAATLKAAIGSQAIVTEGKLLKGNEIPTPTNTELNNWVNSLGLPQ